MSPASSCGKLCFEEHPQRQTVRFNTRYAAAPDDDCGAVSGVMDLYLSGRLGQPAHQRGVLSRQRTFAEKAVDVGDNLAERQGHAGQATEQGMKLCHQHGSGHALPGDVAQ